MVVTEQSLCVSDLIRHESITTLFQPLVSIKKKSIIGIEALSRGIDPYDGRMIPPNVLFDQATREDILLDLDRLCRDKACENFAALCQHITEKPILFLNIDTSIIDTGVVGSQYLLNQIKQSGLDPSTIAIEIIESKVHDHQALQRFVETYRDYGFIIALDDVGAGHSNLDRISLVKPDVIKIDRSLITDINREYYKQIVVKSLVSLAQNIGALVVAEGIENENEAVTTLELGADLLQGFYFSRPQEANWERLNNAAENIAHVATDYRSSMISHVRELKARYQAYDDMIADLVCELSCAAPRDYDVTLQVLADRYHI
ncbi:MAG TPA: EAL domain-containing protein, partial [Armatimonadota bacterium]|nr:EAL domain-containing protein [Armatimonadota bacterium]